MSAALLIDSRPHSATRHAVSTALSPYRTGAPVTSTSIRSVSVTVEHFSAAVVAGHRVVDIRSQAQRDAAGIVAGALAIDASVVLDRLVPGTPLALRAASADAGWILVSADGDDAEWLAWHLQARGVLGARFLLGGAGALLDPARQVGADLTLARHGRRDLATIAAH